MSSSQSWWRTAAVYQVYIRSFADGNGDGTGDIAGLRSRLPYLSSLGVDAIWINPWYRSPLKDGGYDVADYRDIDPRFGTLEEATELIAEAGRHGLRVILDLVPNHTSHEHPWFQEALRSPPGSQARARYHFRAGKGSRGEAPPTDWRSVFGGPAWTALGDGDWYLHLFDATQPDLNWDNPEVRAEIADVIRFWLARGAAGFRVDVAHSLAKDPAFPDVGDEEEALLVAHETSNHPFWDRPEIHDIAREWRHILDGHGDHTMMVAEAWVATLGRLARYLRRGGYHQAFDFAFLETPWGAGEMRVAVTASLAATAEVGALPTWVLSNHDVVRHASRFGLPGDVHAKTWLLDGDRAGYDPVGGLRRARAATLMMLALPGSAYLYQGEELGLGEVHDLPPEVLDDPVWTRSGGTEKGRDGCRVPLPWTVGGPSFGFGDGTAWLPQPPGWGELSVEAQTGRPGSTLEMYRSALAIRRSRLTDDLELAWDPAGRDLLAFRRGSGLRCVVNFGDTAWPIPAGDVLVASGPLEEGRLPPDTAVWVMEEPAR
jgi:alpha-glucosidase